MRTELLSTMATSGDGESRPYYTVAITGSTGLVGTALIDELTQGGRKVNGKEPRVIRLVRGTSAVNSNNSNDKELMWNPNSDDLAMDPGDLKDVDAVIHLAGENVATNLNLGPLNFVGIRPWSSEKKDAIMNSRTGPTRALAASVAAASSSSSGNGNGNGNGGLTFVTASGVGVYGGDFIGEDCRTADETDDVSQTKGFLADVSRAWEAASVLPKNDTNNDTARVVNLRFGVVLSRGGGTLGKLVPVFQMGGGGRVGPGQQYLSFVSARDAARAVVHTLETPALTGPVNVCAPEPCTNAVFARALGHVLQRPTLVPLPAFLVQLLFGDMGEELLLGGTRARPTRLTDTGFRFRHPDIDSALRSAVHEETHI